MHTTEPDLKSVANSISNTEWRVMQVIWKNEPISSNQVFEKLECSLADWTQATIKTLLHRLVGKGVLEFQRKGKRYLYRSLVSQDDCIEKFSERMLNTLFDGRPIPMLEYLVKSSRLNADEIQALRTTLTEIQNDVS